MREYETHIMKDPQLPFIFHREICLGTTDSFRGASNWHENIELLYCVGGQGFVTCDGVRIPFTGGDLVAIGANSLHSVTNLTDKLCYRCLIIDRSFCLANFVDTNRLRLETHFRDGVLAAFFDILEGEYREGEPLAYRTQTVRAAVLGILARLCRCHSAEGNARDGDTRGIASIKRAIAYIRNNPADELTLDGISTGVGLSKYHFAREFRRITGYTFVTYVNTARCERAKSLLAESRMTIAEVSRASGFSSPSYFTRIFREHTGMLPGAYREKQAAK